MRVSKLQLSPFLIRCTFEWADKSVQGFFFGSRKKVARKVYHLKGNEKRNLMALVSVA